MPEITSNKINSHTYECIVTSWETLKNGMPYGKETIMMAGLEPPEWGEWIDKGNGFKQRPQSISFVYDRRYHSAIISSITEHGGELYTGVYEVVFDHDSDRVELQLICESSKGHYHIHDRPVSESTFDSYIADLVLYKPD